MEGFFGGLLSRISNEYGIMAGVFTLALAISFSFNIKGIISFLKYHRSSWKLRYAPLSEHPMFNEIRHIVSHRLLPLNIHTHCIIRKSIYIDFMREKIAYLEAAFREFIRNDFEKMNQRELYLEIRKTIEDAELKANSHLAGQNNIPQIVLEKMQEKIKETWSSYRNQIKLCCNSEYLYRNNHDRIYSVMDIIPYMIEHYMNILENSLAEFNGEIKNLNYRGVTCRGCRVCVHAEYLNSLQRQIDYEETHIDLDDDDA